MCALYLLGDYTLYMQIANCFVIHVVFWSPHVWGNQKVPGIPSSSLSFFGHPMFGATEKFLEFPAVVGVDTQTIICQNILL